MCAHSNLLHPLVIGLFRVLFIGWQARRRVSLVVLVGKLGHLMRSIESTNWDWLQMNDLVLGTH